MPRRTLAKEVYVLLGKCKILTKAMALIVKEASPYLKAKDRLPFFFKLYTDTQRRIPRVSVKVPTLTLDHDRLCATAHTFTLILMLGIIKLGGKLVHHSLLLRYREGLATHRAKETLTI